MVISVQFQVVQIFQHKIGLYIQMDLGQQYGLSLKLEFGNHEINIIIILCQINTSLLQLTLYQQELVNYLPSYMQFRTIYFTLQGPGTVSASAFTSTITGVGTQFSQPFNPPTTYGVSVGHKIEIVDDLNFVNIFTIKSINSDTSLTVNELITHTITGCYYRIPSNTVSQ